MKTIQSKHVVVLAIFIVLSIAGTAITSLGVYEEEATGKVVTLRWFNIILLSIMVITVVITWFLIVQPLIKTLRGIVDNLSNGAERLH
jgi:TRAP-type C4-dicarboxylate transport system permease small subunit